MHPYRLPLKFTLLWIANLALILTITLTTGFHHTLLRIIRIQGIVWIYLFAGAVLAGLEQALWDKLRGN